MCVLPPRHVTDGLLKGADASQAAHYVAMEKATAAEVLKGQEEVPSPSSVKPDVVPLMVHQAQSSPVLLQPSQHSLALPNPGQAVPIPAGTTAATQEGGPMPQSPQTPVSGATMQSLLMEDLHGVGAKNRAMSIEVKLSSWYVSWPPAREADSGWEGFPCDQCQSPSSNLGAGC